MLESLIRVVINKEAIAKSIGPTILTWVSDYIKATWINPIYSLKKTALSVFSTVSLLIRDALINSLSAGSSVGCGLSTFVRNQLLRR